MVNKNKQLLIVWHSRTGGSEAMAKAAFEGAQNGEKEGRQAAQTGCEATQSEAVCFYSPRS
ncbi:MAG: flavodoxin family protein, partial [Pseudomonadota bacterium]